MTYSPIAPQKATPRTGLWVVLGGAGVLVFIGLAVVVALVSATVWGAILARTAAPHFEADDASAVLLTETQSQPYGTWSAPETTTAVVSDAQSELASDWKGDTPAASALPCEFAYSLYPVTNLETGAQEQQPLALNDQFLSIDTDSTFSQSTRVFGSAGEASAFIGQMRQLVAGCTSYSTSSWSATVAPLTLPGVSISHSAWVETGTASHTGGSYFAADLQRGNIVTRITADAASTDSGKLNSTLFDAVVKTAAANLQALKPGSGGTQA
ncbi:hypothetical protein [Subtercola lobariae]|uniref:PknH-like extracellular domain-containing protein n=1 Tax=Subtercola lobariae TaxID=1588641 RepID=A0A917EX40_9MICO|nr:hypothetical protein [Subtercola lobariae]GGF27488.1 hypothetical protein GCM10011399_20970 [Subtercola lobariae]